MFDDMVQIAGGDFAGLYLGCGKSKRGVYLFDCNRELDESDEKEDDEEVLYYVCASVTQLFANCKNYRDAVLAWGTVEEKEQALWDKDGNLEIRRAK